MTCRHEAKSASKARNRAPQAMQRIVEERDEGIWGLMSRSKQVMSNPG